MFTAYDWRETESALCIGCTAPSTRPVKDPRPKPSWVKDLPVKDSTANTKKPRRGGIEGGAAAGQRWVVRDWQALQVLDKPTRAV